MRTHTTRPARRARAATLVALILLVASTPVQSQPAHRSILAGKLRTRLAEIATTVPGVLGAQVLDVTSGQRIGVNDTLVFPQGSAIKIAILTELYRQEEAGELKLTDQLPVRRADMAAGSGLLQRFGDGTSTLALRDVAVMMIVLSDNTATNMLIERTQMARINATMRSLGVPSIQVKRKMIQPRESAMGNENVATPHDAATLMARIARCDLPMSKERCADLRRILEIPKGGPVAASVGPGVRVAWKPGGIEGVSTYWALVDLPGAPYAVTAMVNYATDGEQVAEALRAVADAAATYMQALARSTPTGARVPLEEARRVVP